MPLSDTKLFQLQFNLRKLVRFSIPFSDVKFLRLQSNFVKFNCCSFVYFSSKYCCNSICYILNFINIILIYSYFLIPYKLA